MIKEDTWSEIVEIINSSRNEVKVLKSIKEQEKQNLLGLQVTTKSYLGAISYLIGGLLIDNGWIRILGSGHDLLPRNVADWNEIDEKGKPHTIPGALLVADDVIGGFFAINTGRLGNDIRKIYHLSPDTLEWESLDVSYSSFLLWVMTGDLESFYGELRWKGWPAEVSRMNGDQGILFYPFIWAAGENLSKRSKKIVPIQEIWDLTIDLQKKLGKV